jgi:hypothetical protein
LHGQGSRPTVRCRAGLEQGQDFPGKLQDTTEGGAKSGAASAKTLSLDPDLTHVVAAWPVLPPHIKAAVLALVE